MKPITSILGACCVALLLPAVADAQGPSDRVAFDGGFDIASRPLRAETYTAVPGVGLEADDVELQACRRDSITQQPDPENPRWIWRLRAYRYLDCVLMLVDGALATRRVAATSGDDNQLVQLSRNDLERIRTLAWWARDAAARIGQ